MGAIVAFNYTIWKQKFPKLGYVTELQAQSYFDMATTLQVNDGSGPVNNAAVQTNMLDTLTAHLAALFSPPDSGGGSSPAIVGRISSATEGSVTVTTEWAGEVSDNEAFYIQTQYGAVYWQMRKAFLTMRYVPRRVGGPVPGYGGLI